MSTPKCPVCGGPLAYYVITQCQGCGRTSNTKTGKTRICASKGNPEEDFIKKGGEDESYSPPREMPAKRDSERPIYTEALVVDCIPEKWSE